MAKGKRASLEEWQAAGAKVAGCAKNPGAGKVGTEAAQDVEGQPAAAVPKKRHKYNAQRTEVDGEAFDSKKEAERWQELQLELRAGDITALRRQVKFGLTVNGEVVATYVADFEYRDKAGLRVVEDSKGVRTPEYQIKKRLMAACHGIIKES